jgi:hypothetical protein
LSTDADGGEKYRHFKYECFEVGEKADSKPLWALAMVGLEASVRFSNILTYITRARQAGRAFGCDSKLCVREDATIKRQKRRRKGGDEGFRATEEGRVAWETLDGTRTPCHS